MSPTPESLRQGMSAPNGDTRALLAWTVLRALEDPEIPALTLLDLGVIRFVRERPDGRLEIGLSPTYTGCPATAVIRRMVEEALAAAELPAVCKTVLSPPWSSDWITPDGRRKLQECGIVPPQQAAFPTPGLPCANRPVACPRCHSIDTESVSEFGSTPCKALRRCRACLEPFESFKCI